MCARRKGQPSGWRRSMWQMRGRWPSGLRNSIATTRPNWSSPMPEPRRGPEPGSPSEGVETATRQVKVNLLGSINTVEPLLPALCRRGRGRVAFVASIAAYRGLPDSPGYCASKAGLRAYAEALRPRLAAHGVRVTIVCPGFFDSPMTDRLDGPTPFLISVEARRGSSNAASIADSAASLFHGRLFSACSFATSRPPLSATRSCGAIAFASARAPRIMDEALHWAIGGGGRAGGMVDTAPRRGRAICCAARGGYRRPPGACRREHYC